MIWVIERANLVLEFSDEAEGYVFRRNCEQVLDVYTHNPLITKTVIAHGDERTMRDWFNNRQCAVTSYPYDGYSFDVAEILFLKKYEADDFAQIQDGRFESAQLIALRYSDRYGEHSTLYEPDLYDCALNMSVEEAIERRGIGVAMSDQLIRHASVLVNTSGATQFSISDLGDEFIIWLEKDAATDVKSFTISKSDVIEVRYGCAILYNCVALGLKDLDVTEA